MRKNEEEWNGAGTVVTAHTRNRCGDLEGAEGFGLQGRGQLCGQRRGGAEVQGRDRHQRLQVGVSSFDACAAGIKQVEADLGPVEVLDQQRWHHRDSSFTA